MRPVLIDQNGCNTGSCLIKSWMKRGWSPFCGKPTVYIAWNLQLSNFSKAFFHHTWHQDLSLCIFSLSARGRSLNTFQEQDTAYWITVFFFYLILNGHSISISIAILLRSRSAEQHSKARSSLLEPTWCLNIVLPISCPNTPYSILHWLLLLAVCAHSVCTA